MRDSGFANASAYAGARFAELMSTSGDLLYADFAATPGQTLAWSFAHRGRCAGVDVLTFKAGAASGALATLATATTTSAQWKVYTGACKRDGMRDSCC